MEWGVFPKIKATVTGPHVCGHLCKLFPFFLRLWFWERARASGGLRIWVQYAKLRVYGGLRSLCLSISVGIYSNLISIRFGFHLCSKGSNA